MDWYYAHIDFVGKHKYTVRVNDLNEDGTNGEEFLRFDVETSLTGRALREHCEEMAWKRIAEHLPTPD